MSSGHPDRLIFKAERGHYSQCRSAGQAVLQFVRDQRGWILFGPEDIRNGSRSFTFCLQKLHGQKMPRVIAGCRYYTLPQAWAHWSRKSKRGYYEKDKNEGRQAIAIIRLMLLQVQAYGLISVYAVPIKFDSTLTKPKRK